MSETLIRPRIEARPLAERLADKAPLLLVPLLMLGGLVVTGNPSTWATLTVAGLAMGLMIFIMASGLTLVFGLMDIINFGHGAFVAVGAFIGFTVLTWLSGWTAHPSVLMNLAAMLIAITVTMLATGLMGYGFEKVIIKPVYGQHLKQILVTMGGMIIAQQLIHVVWGPDALHLSRPLALQGSWVIGDAAIEKYRLVAVGIGLALFVAMRHVLKHTKVGLLVRAGVENGEMVEALGYRIRRLFLVVFMVGSALAGLGGVMWGLYQETITAHMGSEIMVLVFIVVIIGGLGSVEGCFIGALLVGLLANYTAFAAPKVALVSTIGLMVVVLMWRPQGLYPVVKAK
ncbi:branched-chain amino acid ABC transporter permease [Microvirga tunisiensis]|uniref:Branched-chain amino acid ABC transporter permease n=2 Tax=Pannonibacter tanglangensis TaxID=2750084 RepID=A0ABW9ZNE2_9HYPH|nr:MULTISPECIES: branched-chain amino acid ABC transporter permease [unclassified Pannonibacter]NBN64577.1 branched-chain amino acid ABC transporter permease [Pannonibacter sp. XCT-34]NBN79112.1 branched-chain amino acid ABC transporter permease [Pannonibacter sp. XCT-53]